jgi:hypothetical protein
MENCNLMLSMLRVTRKKSEPKRRTKYPGICRAAFTLGVSREHLWRVLEGDRESRSLMRRYREFQRTVQE